MCRQTFLTDCVRVFVRVVNDVTDDVRTPRVSTVDHVEQASGGHATSASSHEEQTSLVCTTTTAPALPPTIKHNQEEETTLRDYTAQDRATHDCCSKTQDTTGSDCGELQHTTATKTQDRTAVDASGEDRRSQDRTGGVDYKPQDRTGPDASHLALILKLQRDMATMQLQLSKLQDAMRTANTTLQLLIQQAFNDQ